MPLINLFRVLPAFLIDATKNEGEFPIAMRYHIIATVISYLNESGLTAEQLEKQIFYDKRIYGKALFV